MTREQLIERIENLVSYLKLGFENGITGCEMYQERFELGECLIKLSDMDGKKYGINNWKLEVL